MSSIDPQESIRSEEDENLPRPIAYLTNKSIKYIFGKEQFHFVSDDKAFCCYNCDRKLMGLKPISAISNDMDKYNWEEVTPISNKLYENNDVVIVNAFSFLIYIFTKKGSKRMIQKLKEIYSDQFATTPSQKNLFYDLSVTTSNKTLI